MCVNGVHTCPSQLYSKLFERKNLNLIESDQKESSGAVSDQQRHYQDGRDLGPREWLV